MLSVLSFLFMIAFVSPCTTSFPKQLSKDEESICLEELKKGNKEAKHILVEKNLRLVAHIAKKYSQTSDTEDLISIGTIGLIKAIDSFNPEKGAKLATYAARCIENEILMHLRSGKKHSNQLYLQDPIGTDGEGNEITILDIIASPERDLAEEIDTNLQTVLLYSKINSILSKRELLVIKLRYGLYGKKSLTQREIGQMLGISRSYVSRIEKKALKKLRLELDKKF